VNGAHPSVKNIAGHGFNRVPGMAGIDIVKDENIDTRNAGYYEKKYGDATKMVERVQFCGIDPAKIGREFLI